MPPGQVLDAPVPQLAEGDVWIADLVRLFRELVVVAVHVLVGDDQGVGDGVLLAGGAGRVAAASLGPLSAARREACRAEKRERQGDRPTAADRREPAADRPEPAAACGPMPHGFSTQKIAL